MNISLTPALEQFVNNKVESGLYNSVSEVIREALRLLIAHDGVPQERLNMLNKDIELGLSDKTSYDGNLVMQNLVKKYEQ